MSKLKLEAERDEQELNIEIQKLENEVLTKQSELNMLRARLDSKKRIHIAGKYNVSIGDIVQVVRKRRVPRTRRSEGKNMTFIQKYRIIRIDTSSTGTKPSLYCELIKKDGTASRKIFKLYSWEWELESASE